MPPYKKSTPFARDKTLDQKDYSMTSTNALNNAVATYGFESELAKVKGEEPASPVERILELHELYFQLHIAQVPGDLPAQFPGSTVVESKPAASTPAAPVNGSGVTLGFGKYQGQAIADVYHQDPSYVRWLAGNAREDNVKQAARQVMAENGEEEADPYAA